MPSSLFQLLFLVFFTCHIFSSFSQRPTLPNTALIFPVTKDATTLQYTTKILMGSPPASNKLVLDLGGPVLWTDCSQFSSSHKPIKSGSLQCSMASSCKFNQQNTITKTTTPGHLSEGIITVDLHSHNSKSISTVHDLLFSCAPNFLLQGLASGANGMLGLGRSKLSLPSQLSNTFETRRKFSICLSESDGIIFSGDMTSDMYKYLTYTPLIYKSTSHDYYINVESVKVSNKRLALGTKSIDTKISTVVPYTTMDTTTYDIFVHAFIVAAKYINMTRVVAPVTTTFGVCFSYQGSENILYIAPTIELVLQSEMVKWKIHGRNSMVKISEKVVCLGILDGGFSVKREIIIGGYQLENNLLEFDYGRSMLGFSSLLMRESSCNRVRDTLYANHVQ